MIWDRVRHKPKNGMEKRLTQAKNRLTSIIVLHGQKDEYDKHGQKAEVKITPIICQNL